jgi:paraquat-inducible protein A
MTDQALSAASQNLSSCHMCLKLADASNHRCPRCGSKMHLRKANSLQRTVALLVTASILYIPANLLPIMITDQLGVPLESTIMGGIILLIKLNSIPVAAVIFIASIMVPLSKLLALYYLCWSVAHGPPSGHKQRTVLYRLAESIGKWSMIDVFVVAILVALVQLGEVLAIRPGTACLSFAGVVIITIIAAESFDPRLIWEQLDNEDDSLETEDN